ncbi:MULTISPECIES: phage/plasmid primase, P4 family [Comamonas]|uniref:DNA primase family protein n=1 Tax=Comamonas TaxID=283 RepID=UPI0001DA69D0|nr:MULTISPECIES: phage/plasmid primase, P4 family [Comamonas]EFI61449.1 Phage/plasmid primase P4 [Comamonas thiooxydans]TFF62128.1 DNA primase [Comamonas sp. A23]
MSRRPPFEPIVYAQELEKSGNYATYEQLLYRWTGTHWSMVDDESGVKQAMRWIADGNHGIVNPSNAKSTHQTALLWLPSLKETHSRAIIPVKNGYLHLDGTPSLLPHDKKLGIRHVLDCNFDPAAATPTEFFKLLERILPDAEVRDRVQEYCGYTLLPDARFQCAQLWVGSGANGKGTLANILQALHTNKAAASPNKLDGFHAATVLGASLLYCDEAPPNDWCEQTLKSMVAGESVAIDRKYLPPITARVTGKWLILANHIPAIKDQSNGFWRRFGVVPFPVSIPAAERDPLLAERIIKHELSAVLNWAVEGLQRLLLRGRFDPNMPRAMQNAIQSAKVETNSVHSWISDAAIELMTDLSTAKAEVYAVYSAWCKQNGMLAVSAPKFWKRLQESLGEIIESRSFTSEGARIRTCNVRLTS